MQVGFFPLGTVALVLRMVTTLVWLRPELQLSWWLRTAMALAAWLLLCLLQPALGYALKLVAHRYVCYRTRQAGGKTVPRVIHAPKESGSGGAAQRGGGGVAGSSAMAAMQRTKFE